LVEIVAKLAYANRDEFIFFEVRIKISRVEPKDQRYILAFIEVTSFRSERYDTGLICWIKLRDS
jgi:hypothetical protein